MMYVLDRLYRVAPLVTIALVLSALVLGAVRLALAQPTVSLPTATLTSVTSGASVSIVGYNPSRHAFQICNNGGSTVTVVPGTTAAVAASGVQILVNTCFNPPSFLAYSGTTGGMGAPFQAIAAGATSVVTVLEY